MQIDHADRIVGFGSNPYSDEITRLIRFVIVGVLGTSLDFGLLVVLKSSGVSLFISNSLSFSVGTLNNFFLNRTWTFKMGRIRSWQGQFIRFTTVSLVGLLLNGLIILMLEAPIRVWLDEPELSYLPAKAVATGLVLFWNYFANKFWTFRNLLQAKDSKITDDHKSNQHSKSSERNE